MVQFVRNAYNLTKNYVQHFSDMESAESVLDVMKESNLEPSSDTYTLLASGYAKMGNIGKVLEIFDTCDSKEIYLSDKDYLDVVFALASSGNDSDIDQVIILWFDYCF